MWDVTGLDGGSERSHVVVKSISHVDQSEAESSRFQILSSCDASESSTHHHHMDALHLRHLAPHLRGHTPGLYCLTGSVLDNDKYTMITLLKTLQ